jgi:uncharacterized protein (DUF1501 family)
LSVAGTAAPFALNLAGINAAAAAAAMPTDYRALVCVFLYGANDQNNTIIPLDTPSFNIYKNLRPSIARDLADLRDNAGKLLELDPKTPLSGSNAGRRFALPKELAPLKSIWDSGKLAVLANVGPLVRPITKAQYLSGSVPVPANLFSHNDQQNVWQTFAPEGGRIGWGGRMGDLFQAANGSSVFTCNSISGSAVWLAGQTVAAYQVGIQGSTSITALRGNVFGSTAAPNAIKTLISSGSANFFVQDLASTTVRSIEADGSLTAALASSPELPLPADQAGNALAAQLRQVARMIAARTSLKAKRQLFLVSLGGFDTHDSQLDDQPELHKKLAGALTYFQATIDELGLANSVTTFTASDFGRTLTSNGDGSDHGWGSHHFIMGGAVNGKEFYGTFPIMGIGNADEVGSGRLLPSTSVDQYAATLARWFGVSNTDMKLVIPNIGAFSDQDLGFFT